MKARLIILIVLAAGLAVFFALPKKAAAPGDEMAELSPAQKEEIRVANILKEPLGKRPLPGVEPPEAPEVLVQVEVDRSGGKNRLNFNISENHGYYVETFILEVWYTGSEGYSWTDSPLRFEVPKPATYLRANETLRECVEVVPAELANIGDDIGTTEDWDVRLIRHGRAREVDPDPLPLLPDYKRCTS